MVLYTKFWTRIRLHDKISHSCLPSSTCRKYRTSTIAYCTMLLTLSVILFWYSYITTAQYPLMWQLDTQTETLVENVHCKKCQWQQTKFRHLARLWLEASLVLQKYNWTLLIEMGHISADAKGFGWYGFGSQHFAIWPNFHNIQYSFRWIWIFLHSIKLIFTAQHVIQSQIWHFFRLLVEKNFSMAFGSILALFSEYDITFWTWQFIQIWH